MHFIGFVYIVGLGLLTKFGENVNKQYRPIHIIGENIIAAYSRFKF